MPKVRTVARFLRHEPPKIKGSRFIASLQPVESAAAAKGFVTALRDEARDATHHCFAWRIGTDADAARSSDDGEPSGTAGRPILQELDGRRLTNLAVVVTRYYGGTKLGTGGLIRAYGGAAGAALDLAEIIETPITGVLRIAFAYDFSGAVQGVLNAFGPTTKRADYGAQVQMEIAVPVEDIVCLEQALKDATRGQITIDRSPGPPVHRTMTDWRPWLCGFETDQHIASRCRIADGPSGGATGARRFRDDPCRSSQERRPGQRQTVAAQRGSNDAAGFERGGARAGGGWSVRRQYGEGAQGFSTLPETARYGVVGKATWKELDEPISRALGPQLQRIAKNLRDFDGDPDWVHLLEGHKGRPYWPEGASGVTLDPGIDLGHADSAFVAKLIDDHYGALMSAAQRSAVNAVIGIKGDEAKKALAADAVLKSIRIDREHADEVFPSAAKPYWEAISGRFAALADPETPPSVQTALLSLAYNRGAGNRHLEPLGAMLAAGDWVAAANKIGAMQQDHKQKGIRRRRREEAALIRAELECMQA